MEVKLNNATFLVTLHNGGDEYTGECAWEVKRKQLAEVFAATEMDNDFFGMESEEFVFDPDDDEDEGSVHSSADALIVFLAAASRCEPTTYEIDYYGSGYWFCHDLIHAEYDSGDGSSIYIDQDSEERALPMGGKLAAQHGVSISEILGEIVKAQGEFESRFNYKFDAIEAFLDSVELVLKQ